MTTSAETETPLVPAPVFAEDVWLDSDDSVTLEMSEAADDQRRRAAAQNCHLQYLAMSLGVLVLAFMLTTPDNERVDVPGGWTVPELCAVKAWFGATCPGCGLTRSFVHAFDGRWNEALAMHPIGPLFVFVVIAQIPYRIWRVRSIGQGRSIESPRWTTWFGRALIAALIGQWLLRMFIEPIAK